VVRQVREERAAPDIAAGVAARSILSPTTGFIREAGFTHSLTPARNCTFGCTYCYVPTMRIYAGLKREDWERWGQFTTFKGNAADLLSRELRPEQRIYCSPLVDPYQPAEQVRRLMPAVLETVIAAPPAVFCLQTRGPLILRDVELLRRIPRLRVSFSVTTNREDVRRLYEPHCAPFEERLAVIRTLRSAGIEVFATLAPLLPCDPEDLAEAAIEASGNDLVGDPLHVRSVKRFGATTREQALRIAERRGHQPWLDPEFQREIVSRIEAAARSHGRRFLTGPSGFALLSK
jgi:DNA repair photolyase